MSTQDRIDGYATALFEVARAEGSLDEVEDELFRFARTLEGSDELRNVLVDEAIPAVRREGIVEELLGGKASGVTTSLVSFVVGAGRGRDLPAIIDQLVARAAAEKQLAVADFNHAPDRLGLDRGVEPFEVLAQRADDVVGVDRELSHAFRSPSRRALRAGSSAG